MKNLEGKRAILYRRVSTTDQKDFGNSLSEQKSRLREFCLIHKVSNIIEFEEDFSAKNFIRPEFGKLLEYAIKNKENIDLLLIHKWDRFSRNALEALQIIDTFKRLNIEVNCIDQWIEHDDPTQKMMLFLYLGMPEVDNLIRSEKVIDGNRRALKEGRWIHSKPKGYISGKDELGKTLMIPDKKLAPLIAELFHDFSSGGFSQQEILKMYKYKELNLNRSTLSRILTQIIYAGKVIVPKFKNEPELIVEGLHESIISFELFNKVQDVLQRRKILKYKPKKINENFPLRGFLECKKCGGNLTGSASTSRTGTKHFYYHCNTLKGCNERFSVKVAHEALSNLLGQFQPDHEICELFELILEDQSKSKEKSNLSQILKIEDEKRKIENMESRLLDKLLDNIIDDTSYSKARIRLQSKINELNKAEKNLKIDDRDLRSHIKFGVFVFKNLKSIFDQSPILIKQKLLGSILAKKLIFEISNYRTPQFNEAFSYIYLNINELEKFKNKIEGFNLNTSRFVVSTGQFSNSFYDRINGLYQLKDDMIKEQLIVYNTFSGGFQVRN
jgi:DNA invertase Pin-like site-specific DNA recombinase